MSMCDRCRVSGCLLDYNGKACENARKEDCPEVIYTNADRLEEMTIEQMTVFLNAWSKKNSFWMSEYGETKSWLQEPFDGFSDWLMDNY